MLGTEQRLELNSLRRTEQINRQVAPTVVPGVIGDETDAQSLQRREFLPGKNIDAIEDFRGFERDRLRRRGLGAGLTCSRRQRARNVTEIEFGHRLGGQVGEG